MDPATVETAAAQPPAPPPTEPAAEPARPDFASFHEARTAKALGREPQASPAPAVKPPADSQGDDAPAVDATGEQIRDASGQFVSKRKQREIEQEQRTRAAVDRAVAGLKEQHDRELADLRAQIQGREPAAEPITSPPADDGPAKPKMADFEAKVGAEYPDYATAIEAYHDARDAYREELAAREKAKQAETESKTAEQKAFDDLAGKHYERERALTEKTPDYLARVEGFRSKLQDTPLTRALLRSERSAELLLHLSEHPDDLARIGALGHTDHEAALRALWDLERTFDTPAPAAAPAAPAAIPRKLVTSAPDAPTTLGTRTAEPANAEHAAVASKDFRAFHEGRTAKALDVARGRR